MVEATSFDGWRLHSNCQRRRHASPCRCRVRRLQEYCLLASEFVLQPGFAHAGGTFRHGDCLGWKASDAERQIIHEEVDLAGRQRPIDVTVALGDLGREVTATQDDFQRPATPATVTVENSSRSA